MSVTRAESSADTLPTYPRLSYATVRDYCDSADHFPKLATFQNDLKDVQRPWTVKAILSSIKAPARLIEIGSGEPLSASALADLGYEVSVCDPFDGSGRGPTEFAYFRSIYRNVNYIRSYFDPEVARQFENNPLDVVFSISVLEHVPEPALLQLFEAALLALRPGGFSIHCADIVIEGQATDFHIAQLKRILTLQENLAGTHLSSSDIDSQVHDILRRAKDDLETFYLSAHGHNQWRGKLAYAEFSFRKVISVQSIVQKS